MTASVLIQLLQGVPPDTEVTVQTHGLVLRVTGIVVPSGRGIAIVAGQTPAFVAGRAEYDRLRGESESPLG
jgi:hypothetical protein